MENQFTTDVEGIFADDHIAQGTERFPVFNVDRSEFYQNTERGRRMLQFSPDSTVNQYLTKTQYNRPFYLRHKGEDGQTFIRKIK